MVVCEALPASGVFDQGQAAALGAVVEAGERLRGARFDQAVGGVVLEAGDAALGLGDGEQLAQAVRLVGRLIN